MKSALPVGIVCGQVEVPHDVGNGQRRRPRDARQTVHNHAAIGLAYFVCKK